MLINKENTPYGYKARVRYDVKNPVIHVLQKNETLTIEGDAIITVISGEVSAQRNIDGTTSYDNLEDKDTSTIPLETKVDYRAKTLTVLLEDNNTKNRVEQYLKLEVEEDEPSSEDLQYIDEE